MLTVAAQDQTDDNRQYCAGMYSRTSWNGPVDPFILVKFLGQSDVPQGSDPVASMVIFEWKDEELIGIPDPDGYGNVSKVLWT